MRHILCCACCCAVFWVQTDTLWAVEPVANTHVDALLEAAAAAQVAGDDDERQRLLQTAIDQAPDDPRARWQLGEVRYRGAWRAPCEVQVLTRSDGTRNEYTARRDACGEDADAHVQLARWCQRNDLSLQARAHYEMAVALDSENAEARKRLGYVRFGREWVLEEDVEAAKRQQRETSVASRKWKPRLTRIARGLAHRDVERRLEASRQLHEIDDVRAVPVMQWALAANGPFAAGELIDALDQFEENEASIALARQAVFSPYDEVRAEACDRLQARSPDSYLPVLVRSLRRPISVEWNSLPFGSRTRQLALTTEDFDARWAMTTNVSVGNDFDLAMLLGEPNQLLRRATRLDAEVENRNNQIEQMNERVTWVLGQVTGQDLGEDPGDWWDYWYRYTDYEQSEKPLYLSEAPSMVIPSRSYECFVAGTPVWTALGTRPIESIQVGDVVFSQDPETGELAMKPVVRVTARRAPKLVTVDIAGEQITSTDGHPYWVMGQGWKRARDLQPADGLCSTNRSVSVGQVTTAESDQVYNLEVADFRTYFVGASRVLVHDNTYFAATYNDVPGYKLARDE